MQFDAKGCWVSGGAVVTIKRAIKCDGSQAFGGFRREHSARTGARAYWPINGDRIEPYCIHGHGVGGFRRRVITGRHNQNRNDTSAH